MRQGFLRHSLGAREKGEEDVEGEPGANKRPEKMDQVDMEILEIEYCQVILFGGDKRKEADLMT